MDFGFAPKRLVLAPEDVLMCMLPLDHVFGFVCGLLWGLSCGACVALGRGQRHYFDDLKFFKPTALSAVPMLLGFLWQKQLLNREPLRQSRARQRLHTAAPHHQGRRSSPPHP